MRRFACLVVVIALIGCSGKKDGQPEKDGPDKPALTEPVAKLREVDLWNAYNENAVAADAKYKGKTVQVSGTVTVIEPDRIGFSVLADDDNATIVCWIDPAHKAGFEKAKKDLPFTIVGRCVGTKKKSGVYMDRIVILDQCQAK